MQRGDLELGKVEALPEHVNTYDDPAAAVSECVEGGVPVLLPQAVVHSAWPELGCPCDIQLGQIRRSRNAACADHQDVVISGCRSARSRSIARSASAESTPSRLNTAR